LISFIFYPYPWSAVHRWRMRTLLSIAITGSELLWRHCSRLMESGGTMKVIAAAAFAAVIAMPAFADCPMPGGNRPALEVNPASRIDPNAPQMRCDIVVREMRMPNGSIVRQQTYLFSIQKR
jgi:hypothetical protein